MNFNGKFYGTPHPVWLGTREVIGYITQEVWATEYWNSSYQRNLFSSVTYHTSYISPYGVGFSWTPKPYTHSIIDGGRTIEASADGLVVLGVKIGDYVAGFTWSMAMTDWFSAV
ncbi:hypothetical protein [Desulfitobacterium sp.]|uniref:hypothetical protein n=1 Tax=Desulfitobacterium sp. TaxID=49981 RepID=UPI002BF38825|nr:hypothetical protein [Desulfitobacterium sp.]HVJ49622.1 hypothetical protein [Desulfitobacterium sp.]